MNRSFFLAGIPAAGKSWLGTWLGEAQDYLHVDAEKNNGADFDALNIHSDWDGLITTGRAEQLAEAIGALPKPVVINWGFPPCYLYVVKALQVAGVAAWWIHGDRQLARQAFLTRGGIDPCCFEQQMDQIQRHWLLIEHVFTTRLIDGFTATGQQRHPKEMWEEISSRAQ